MGFSRQGYWSGLPFSSPKDLPNPGIEPRSPILQAGALPSEPPGIQIQTTIQKLDKPQYLLYNTENDIQYLILICNGK